MKNFPWTSNVIITVWLFLNLYLPQLLIAKSAYPNIMPSNGDYYEDDGSTKTSVDLISEIAIKMASAADIMMHYEDTTITFVNAVSRKSNTFYMDKISDKITVQKSNTFTYKARYVVQILKCYRKGNNNLPLHNFVHTRSIYHFIIISDPRNFTVSQVINNSDVILYICINEIQSEAPCLNQNFTDHLSLSPFILLNTTYLKSSNLVMMLEITDEYTRLYELCYYCGVRSEKFTLKFESKLDYDLSQTSSKLLNSIIEIVDSQYNDFHGHRFRVAFSHDKIYVGCKNEVNTEVNEDVFTECSDMVGTEGLMLIEFSKRMNFKYSLVNPKIHDDVGPWKNMVNDVNRSKVDFAIGSITISASRLKKVDYSINVGEDPLRVVYMVQRNIFSEGLIIVLVFTSQTWILLLFTMALLSVLVCAVEKYLFSGKISLLGCFWVVCRILIEQGIGHSERIPGRRVLFSWLFCCIIICTVYKAKLTSLLVNPPTDHLSTLEELIKAGYDAYLNELDGSLVTGTLELSSDPVMKQLLKRTHVNRSICNVLKDAITTNIMLIEEQVPIQLAVNKKCPKIMTKAQLARIRVTMDHMLPSSHAWVFRKKTPYLNKFNRYIALLYENGIKSKWDVAYRTATKKNHINFVTGIVNSDENQPAMYGPLIMWSLGMVIAMMCFVGEVFFSFFIVSKRFKK